MGPWCDAGTQAADEEDLASIEDAGSSAGDEDTAECPRFAAGSLARDERPAACLQCWAGDE
jgi:hypothetical protein